MPNRTDYIIVILFLIEVALIVYCLLNKVSALGYILPLCIAAVAFTIAIKAYMDFFKMHVGASK